MQFCKVFSTCITLNTGNWCEQIRQLYVIIEPNRLECRVLTEYPVSLVVSVVLTS